MVARVPHPGEQFVFAIGGPLDGAAPEPTMMPSPVDIGVSGTAGEQHA